MMNKIVNKILAIVIAAMLIVSGSFVVAIFQYISLINSEYAMLAEDSRVILDEYMNDISDDMEIAVNTIKEDKDFQNLIVKNGALSDKLAYYNNFLSNTYISYIAIADKDGNYIESNISSVIGQSAGLKHITDALAGNETSCFEKSADTKLGYFTGIPVKNDKDQVVAVISLGADIANINNLKAIAGSDRNFFAIYNEKSQVASTINGLGGLQNAKEKLSDDIYDQIVNEGKDYVVKKKINNKNYTMIYSSFFDKKLIGVSAVCIDSIVGGLLKVNLISIVLILALLIGTVAALRIFVIKYIGMPVEKVTKLADRISGGDLGINSKNKTKLDTKSQDEIGELARALTNTVSMLQSYIGDIEHMLSTISKGDLTMKVMLDYKGDFVGIRSAISNITVSLKEIINRLLVSSQEVTSGSDEVSKAAQAMSQGSIDQAREVDKLSVLIRENSNKIALNAKDATEASGLTNEANSIVDDCLKSFMDMNAEMEKINDTTAKMNNVVQTIDDFAFQTNVLALNASIEAARAGSYGKGFAVVADEVRNLANKSAGAAKETGVLIREIVELVEGGMRFSDLVGNKIAKVVDVINGIVEKIDHIAVKSNEQAESTTMIVNSVEEISKVIHTNSSTAERCAAASEELSALANELRELIDTFKTEENAERYDRLAALREAEETEMTYEDTEDYDGLDDYDFGDSVDSSEEISASVSSEAVEVSSSEENTDVNSEPVDEEAAYEALFNTFDFGDEDPYADNETAENDNNSSEVVEDSEAAVDETTSEIESETEVKDEITENTENNFEPASEITDETDIAEDVYSTTEESVSLDGDAEVIEDVKIVDADEIVETNNSVEESEANKDENAESKASKTGKKMSRKAKKFAKNGKGKFSDDANDKY